MYYVIHTGTIAVSLRNTAIIAERSKLIIYYHHMFLTYQMTTKFKKSTHNGLSALIQAAASQLGDLGETTTVIEATAITPTMESEYSSGDVSDLDLDGNSSHSRICPIAFTVTSLLTSSFPEVLMHLLVDPANENIITFLPDGKYFAIRRVDFTDLLLYKHFHLTSYDDFLELILNWGFIRVNGNSINNADNNNHDSNDNTVPSCSSSGKADIYVFRHLHFEKKQPIDLNKIKYKNVNKLFLSQTILQKCVSEESTNASSSNKTIETTHSLNNTNIKQQLSPSYIRGDSDDYHNRFRLSTNDISKPTPILGPFSLSSSNYCDQPSQLRRRSSFDYYSDFSVHNSHSNRSTHITNNGTRHSQEQERRHPTASTLVDGGVETATQNIVTDAIEALLFDESHTRDTFMKHEMELSVSSLPGVVPISKQLFSKKNEGPNDTLHCNNNDGGSRWTRSSDGKKKGGKRSTSFSLSSKNTRKLHGRGRKKNFPALLSSSSSSSMLQSSWEIKTTCAITSSLEYASRNSNDGGSLSSNLRVVIPSDDSSAWQQRYVGSMVVSPTRMEAAALLVGQSRYRNDKEFY
mmetsp:Transcript_20212/g.23333  ORF Transcript_20212/g.23333 Transcript_20212/m.23333 type:complete len:577 (-) Transcript_20212:1251-2981(-)